MKLFHASGYRDDFGEKFRRFSRCGYTTLFADGLRHSTTRDFFPSRPSRSPRGNRDSLLSGTRAEPESKINAFAPAVINRMRIGGGKHFFCAKYCSSPLAGKISNLVPAEIATRKRTKARAVADRSTVKIIGIFAPRCFLSLRDRHATCKQSLTAVSLDTASSV